MDDLNKRAWAKLGLSLFENGLTYFFVGLIILVFFVFLDYVMGVVSFSAEYVIANGFSDPYVVASVVVFVVVIVALNVLAAQRRILYKLKKQKENK